MSNTDYHHLLLKEFCGNRGFCLEISSHSVTGNECENNREIISQNLTGNEHLKNDCVSSVSLR